MFGISTYTHTHTHTHTHYLLLLKMYCRLPTGMVKRKQKNNAVKIITEIWSAVLTCTYIIQNCADWFMHAKQCSQNNHRNMISCFNLHIYHSKLCWLVYAWSQNVWPSFNLSLRLFCNVYLSVHNCLNLFLISINVICFFHSCQQKRKEKKKKEQQWQHTHTHKSICECLLFLSHSCQHLRLTTDVGRISCWCINTTCMVLVQSCL